MCLLNCIVVRDVCFHYLISILVSCSVLLVSRRLARSLSLIFLRQFVYVCVGLVRIPMY